MVGDQRQLGAEAVRVGHDVLHRLQLGYVQARLGRHVQLGVAGAQAQALVAGDGPAHAALAPVVGGQGQVPVAEHAIELLQVVQRRARGGEHVAPVVAEGVLLEVEVGARGGHELPHAGGLGAGDGLRIEGAFDVRQQRQLGRHAAALQFLDDVEQVLARALRHAQDVVGPGGVPLLAFLHQVGLQIGHGETAADALPQIGGRRQRSHAGAPCLRWRDGLQGLRGDEAGGGAFQLRSGFAGGVATALGGGAAREPQQAGEQENVQ